jgi:hypothetical protein
MKAPPVQRRLIEQASEEILGRALHPPSRTAQAGMARHLLEEHDYSEFRLQRDVYLGEGERRAAQLLSWNPVQATFRCDECGVTIWTGEITAALVEHAQRFDEGLRGHLVGLGTREERDEMTRRYLNGDLNRQRLRDLRRAGPKRQAASEKRPVVAERRRRIQDWLLERYAARGIVQRVLEEAIDMQQSNPSSWQALALCERRSESALRRDWQDIDPARKAAARLQFERSRSSRN